MYIVSGFVIDGAATWGVKVLMDLAIPTSSKSIDRLTFSAAPSDKTAVVVYGESNPQLLSELPSNPGRRFAKNNASALTLGTKCKRCNTVPHD